MAKEDIIKARELLEIDEREVTATVAHAKYDQAIGLLLLDIAEVLHSLSKKWV